MAKHLNDIVRFRGDLLFNGAVNISWFSSDESKAKDASEAFVFHGPKYHGVQQEDVGNLHGHKLIDTANFARSVIRRCYGMEDQPFTLAIAGYGTGKSHLGLTLASLVSAPKGKTARNILSAIESADVDIGADIQLILKETAQPCLAVALNGMQGFDLSAEITKQIVRTLNKDGHDSKSLDDLRPRFGQAATLVRMSNESVISALLITTEADSIDVLIQKLEQQDERAYAQVHEFFAARGMPIRALSGESVKDVIDIAVKEYCGPGKPYRSLLILFDEFGKYTEFATVKSQIAGSGVLQDLFESIQANSNNACFVGFIQFELNAYVQRIAPEYKNEILRYISRYQSANRLYLSINLETLIASLLEKRQENLLKERFDNNQSISESRKIMANLAKWFPHSQNHRIWGDESLFHSVIRKGCWPLSPYSTWLLFFLAAAGKHLQERSALALLGDAFQRFDKIQIRDISEWSIGPADLWSDLLQQELISSEETGQQGSITHAYASVMAKHGVRLSQEQIKLLRAVVLASKLGLLVDGKEEAMQVLAELAAVPRNVADQEIRLLQEEYNVIEWDESFKAFDILGDAVPRTQFLSFVRKRVASSYDETGKADLFASRAAEWCDLLVDLECDFAEENRISTREWRYSAVTSNLDYLAQQIKISSDRWSSSVEVDEARGTIVYTYVGQSQSAEDVLLGTGRQLRTASREVGVIALPVLVVVLHDADGALGQSLAEFAVLEDISDTDSAKFGNLIGAHKEKLLKSIREKVDFLIKNRLYSTALKDDLAVQRLSHVGTELFKRIYKSPISFPFDGFSTARGNAAETCHELTRELMHGKLDYDGVIAKPVKAKNRAVTVLKDTWGIFNKNGSVSRRPTHPVIRSLTEKWDDALTKEQRLQVDQAIKQICDPPYGANLASAGLFMGVYIAPRHAKLVIMKDGLQLGINQWIEEGIFRGKFINLASLHGVDLMTLGEASSEWETLLDEWEQCPDYLSRGGYLERSLELKQRSPVPPMLVYREERLRELAIAAREELEKGRKIQDDAWDKIEKSQRKMDCSWASWGAAILKERCDSMISEAPLWTDMQIAEMDKDYVNARQYTIQFFPEWLKYQSPRSDNPVEVGDFKHKMIRVIGSNFKKIGLENEFAQIEQHTTNVIKNAEAIAEARQLLRDVQSWIAAHMDSTKIGRIVEIRELKKIGSEYAKKLQGLVQRTNLADIAQVRSQLSEFMQTLKGTEDKLLNRASVLWSTQIRTDGDIEETIREVDSLMHVFDNLQTSDLEDLQSMRKALKLYRISYQRLSDDNLPWDSFRKTADEIQKECENVLGEDEVPWPPEEIVGAFVEIISAIRESKSLTWIARIKEEACSIGEMPAAEANRLHAQLSIPPVVLTAAHTEILNDVIQKVDKRLSDLSIEWLVEKFKELSHDNKLEFVHIVQEILGCR